mgnify:FL=1|jgi:hypothetical protein
MTELTNNDYKHILEYYQKPIPKSKRLLKMNAEKIMSEKLCRCIKKVDNKYEARAIGICTKTIFNKKGYTRGKFKCKGKSAVKFNKTRKNRK